MNKLKLSWVLAIAGLVVVLLSALADVLGFGAPGFGWRQILGVAVGFVLIGIAWYWDRKPRGLA